MLSRAHAVLRVKAAADGARTIAGIATTPTPDRAGDILDPSGATFTNPIPLLLHHDKERPIGLVTLHQPTAFGIAFDATIATIDEPGALRDRVNEAWQSIKAGLITGVSVGYRILPNGIARLASGAARLTRTEICELSLVTVPANMDATIRTIKSLDDSFLAATGPTLPRDGGRSHFPARDKGAPRMTTAEQITQFENTRAAKVARMTAIMDGATDATLDERARDEYDGLSLDVKGLDEHLVRAHELERLNTASAARIVPGTVSRAPVVSVVPNVEPGIRLARYVIAKMVARYENCDAATYASTRWNDSTPDVALALKAAVAAGSTTDATWAKPLVNPSITTDFLPLLRAATILGRITGLMEVPFNVNVPSQTGGGTIQWVGELKPKPVTAMAFAMESLGFSKVAAISVLSQELVRFSNPSAERLVRDSLVKDIAAFLDGQFVNPAVAAVAGVNPASITNGAATAAATSNPLADIVGIINHFAANNIPIENVHILMSPANALSMAFRTNLDGSMQFPGVTMAGGNFRGITILTSNVLGSIVVGLQPSLILYADDGGVTIDASTEASLQMDSAPMSPVDATTVYASMFQMNAVALRAERYINWKRIGVNAVKYLTAANWPAPTAAASPEPPAEDGGTARSRSK